MEKEINGIVHNAFYTQSNHNGVSSNYWGHMQGSNIKIFDYEEDDKGRIIIIKRINNAEEGI